MNQTLEAMAQAIFKEWFVPSTSSGQRNFNFPGFDGELVDGLPKGWRMGKLGDISKNFDSKRIPLSSMERAERKGEYPYYGAASILDYVDDFIFDGTYLLMGEDGTVRTNEGFPVLQYVWGKFWVNNHTHVLQGLLPFSTEYLYLFLAQTNITNLITGAVQPKINQSNMNKIECVLPKEEVLYKFYEVINPIFEKVKTNTKQIEYLTQTRDTLLPKLMSGVLEVESEEWKVESEK
jgi:type I restriction enzyme S subunit